MNTKINTSYFNILPYIEFKYICNISVQDMIAIFIIQVSTSIQVQTGISIKYPSTLLTSSFLLSAGLEWISTEPSNTGTYRYMIDNSTFCIDSTDSWARVSTVTSQTSQMWSTVSIYNTLRSTASSIWVSNIRWNACTPCSPIFT